MSLDTSNQQRLCDCLIESLVSYGVKRFVISPGSRSTPVVLAVSKQKNVLTRAVLDERSAGFIALGLAKASGAPAAVITTSGTAASELYPSLIEASYSKVPVLAITANRPYEQQDIGGPQTIQQDRMFPYILRDFITLHAELNQECWATYFFKIYFALTSTTLGPGPVQVDVKLKEPLIDGSWDDNFLTSDKTDDNHAVKIKKFKTFLTDDKGCLKETISSLSKYKKPLIYMAGEIRATDALVKAISQLKVPVLTEFQSGLRVNYKSVIGANDFLFKVADFSPDLIIRTHQRPTLKSAMNFLKNQKHAYQITLSPYLDVKDPDYMMDLYLHSNLDSFFELLEQSVDTSGWFESVSQIASKTQNAIDDVICNYETLTSCYVAKKISEMELNDFYVSSSMPVRELENFGSKRSEIYRIYSNRGVNGIDGSISTALGIAVHNEKSGLKTVAFLGDLAFLYDLSALVNVSEQSIPNCLFVVIQNGGGEIFKYLDQAKFLENELLNRYFITPYQINLEDLVKNFFEKIAVVNTIDGFNEALKDFANSDFPAVIIAKIDPADNQRVRALIEDKIQLSEEQK